MASDTSLAVNRTSNLYCTDDLSVAMDSPYVVTPQTLYTRKSFATPLSDDEMETWFAASTSLTGSPKSDPKQNRTSTFLQTDTVPCPFMLRGIAVVVKADPFAFSLQGESIDAPAAATDTPAFDGIVPFGAQSTTRPATLDWGAHTWEAAVALAMAYRFRLQFGCDIIAVDESVADIGYLAADNCFTVGSNSVISVHEYIRRVNDRSRELKNEQIFLPQIVDSSTSPATVLPPPQVPITYGGPCLPGTFGGFFPMKYPAMLMPGIPIQTEFFRDPGDSLWHDRLVGALGNTENVITTYDENDTGVVAGNLGYSGVVRYRGGLFSWGVVFKGWRLMSKACVDYFNHEVWGVDDSGKFLAEPKRKELYESYSQTPAMAYLSNQVVRGRLGALAGPDRAGKKPEEFQPHDDQR